MHLLQTAKCGQNAQAATRLALEGTRVVYDPAESPRETVGLEKDSEGAFYTPARTLPRAPFTSNRSPAATRERGTPTLALRQFGPSANTLRYQSTDIYRHAVPNDC